MSNTDPTESHKKSSEPNNLRSSSPKQVDSIPSSPEPSVPPKKFSLTKQDRLPSPQTIDSDSFDSKTPVSHKKFPKPPPPTTNFLSNTVDYFTLSLSILVNYSF